MGYGAKYGPLAYLRRHFHGSGGTETPTLHFGMRWPIGPNKCASFVALGHLLREIIATSGSYYGVRGQ
ncbi:hypothetical protein DPMN_193678 [Dreissena polymorpha]|uniref:Uncharacterized protein n=1 Tax=Dreissena polymorpha TaxID=45954 RepID=A0A9D3XZT9_DREPO|nr:hypothetical protein DPMN_193678 [Dreissena polymorpha]